MHDIVAYVAGPYRCPKKSEWNVLNNIRAAEAVALRLWEHNIPAICPHKNTAFFGGACPNEVWLAGDLILIERCDILVMVPGWQMSEGANAEKRHAESLDKPVFLNWRDAVNYVKQEVIYDTGKVVEGIGENAEISGGYPVSER